MDQAAAQVRSQRSQIDAARAPLASARIKTDNARLTFERAKTLYEQDAQAKFSFDAAKADYDSLREEVKRLEDEGFQFDAAEGSLELLMKKVTGQFQDPFHLESLRVTMEKNRSGPSTSHATIKISVANEEEITAAEGDGPVNALDNALRKALNKFYPQVEEMRLVDFKVRVIDGSDGTAAKVRVQIESRDSSEIWSTIGVSENVIEASWQALVDSVQYKLSKATNGK